MFRILISTLVVILGINVIWAKQPKLHFIALFNTIESTIAPSAKKVHQASKDEFGLIANTIGYEFVAHEILNEDFEGRTKTEQLLQSLQSESQDIIVLHAFAHGFRYQGQSSPFPAIQLSKAKSSRVAIETEELYQGLQSKKARFRLLLVEACNKVELPRPTEKTMLGVMTSMGAAAMKDKNNERYKDLFLRVKGNLIVASAKKGQEAKVPHPNNSGITPFFRHFQTSLEILLAKNEKVKWSNLVANVDRLMQIENKVNGEVFKEDESPSIQEPVCEFRDFEEEVEAITPTITPTTVAYTFDSTTEEYLRLMKQADQQYGQRSYQNALELYQKALNLKPFDYKAKQGVYLCKAMLGQIDFKELESKQLCGLLHNISQLPEFQSPQFAFAQYLYGVSHIKGKGDCEKDWKVAEKWLRVSYKNGIDGACKVWERVTLPRYSICENW